MRCRKLIVLAILVFFALVLFRYCGGGRDYRFPEKINTSPVANAGIDQSVVVGTTVSLDGVSSSDGDGDTLIYVWSIASKPEGSIATIVNVNKTGASLVPDVAGSYTIQLIVNDGTVDSSVASMIITATDIVSNLPSVADNTAPVAKAYAKRYVAVGDTVLLDGSGSTDADNDNLTYSWSLGVTFSHPDPVPTISNANSVNASLVPSAAESYAVGLIVNDGTVDSEIDITIVTATPTNSPPEPTVSPVN